MRTLIVLLAVLGVTVGCAGDMPEGPYGASIAKVGESQAILGWNVSLSNPRWDSDHVLVDIDAAPTDPAKPHAKSEDIRFGLYGALAHPIEATGLGSCQGVTTLAIRPLAGTPDRLSGTICLGPLQEQSAMRGVYVYSPADRIAGTAAAYPAAFPVGVLPNNANDTGGLMVKTTSVDAWRADGTQLDQADLGNPELFSGNGYMLLGLQASSLAVQYRDESAKRGGPMMLVVSPTLPGDGLTRACAVYGSSVLILPDAKLDAVQVSTSLCTQGEINDALLYATLTVVGTHAAVWTTRD